MSGIPPDNPGPADPIQFEPFLIDGAGSLWYSTTIPSITGYDHTKDPNAKQFTNTNGVADLIDGYIYTIVPVGNSAASSFSHFSFTDNTGKTIQNNYYGDGRSYYTYNYETRKKLKIHFGASKPITFAIDGSGSFYYSKTIGFVGYDYTTDVGAKQFVEGGQQPDLSDGFTYTIIPVPKKPNIFNNLSYTDTSGTVYDDTYVQPGGYHTYTYSLNKTMTAHFGIPTSTPFVIDGSGSFYYSLTEPSGGIYDYTKDLNATVFKKGGSQPTLIHGQAYTIVPVADSSSSFLHFSFSDTLDKTYDITSLNGATYYRYQYFSNKTMTTHFGIPTTTPFAIDGSGSLYYSLTEPSGGIYDYTKDLNATVFNKGDLQPTLIHGQTYTIVPVADNSGARFFYFSVTDTMGYRGNRTYYNGNTYYRYQYLSDRILTTHFGIPSPTPFAIVGSGSFYYSLTEPSGGIYDYTLDISKTQFKKGDLQPTLIHGQTYTIVPVADNSGAMFSYFSINDNVNDHFYTDGSPYYTYKCLLDQTYTVNFEKPYPIPFAIRGLGSFWYTTKEITTQIYNIFDDTEKKLYYKGSKQPDLSAGVAYTIIPVEEEGEDDFLYLDFIDSSGQTIDYINSTGLTHYKCKSYSTSIQMTAYFGIPRLLVYNAYGNYAMNVIKWKLNDIQYTQKENVIGILSTTDNIAYSNTESNTYTLDASPNMYNTFLYWTRTIIKPNGDITSLRLSSNPYTFTLPTDGSKINITSTYTEISIEQFLPLTFSPLDIQSLYTVERSINGPLYAYADKEGVTTYRYNDISMNVNFSVFSNNNNVYCNNTPGIPTVIEFSIRMDIPDFNEQESYLTSFSKDGEKYTFINEKSYTSSDGLYTIKNNFPFMVSGTTLITVTGISGEKLIQHNPVYGFPNFPYVDICGNNTPRIPGYKYPIYDQKPIPLSNLTPMVGKPDTYTSLIETLNQPNFDYTNADNLRNETIARFFRKDNSYLYETPDTGRSISSELKGYAKPGTITFSDISESWFTTAEASARISIIRDQLTAKRQQKAIAEFYNSMTPLGYLNLVNEIEALDAEEKAYVSHLTFIEGNLVNAGTGKIHLYEYYKGVEVINPNTWIYNNRLIPYFPNLGVDTSGEYILGAYYNQIQAITRSIMCRDDEQPKNSQIVLNSRYPSKYPLKNDTTLFINNAKNDFTKLTMPDIKPLAGTGYMLPLHAQYVGWTDSKPEFSYETINIVDAATGIKKEIDIDNDLVVEEIIAGNTSEFNPTTGEMPIKRIAKLMTFKILESRLGEITYNIDISGLFILKHKVFITDESILSDIVGDTPIITNCTLTNTTGKGGSGDYVSSAGSGGYVSSAGPTDNITTLKFSCRDISDVGVIRYPVLIEIFRGVTLVDNFITRTDRNGDIIYSHKFCDAPGYYSYKVYSVIVPHLIFGRYTFPYGIDNESSDNVILFTPKNSTPAKNTVLTLSLEDAGENRPYAVYDTTNKSLYDRVETCPIVWDGITDGSGNAHAYVTLHGQIDNIDTTKKYTVVTWLSSFYKTKDCTVVWKNPAPTFASSILATPVSMRLRYKRVRIETYDNGETNAITDYKYLDSSNNTIDQLDDLGSLQLVIKAAPSVYIGGGFYDYVDFFEAIQLSPPFFSKDLLLNAIINAINAGTFITNPATTLQVLSIKDNYLFDASSADFSTCFLNQPTAWTDANGEYVYDIPDSWISTFGSYPGNYQLKLHTYPFVIFKNGEIIEIQHNASITILEFPFLLKRKFKDLTQTDAFNSTSPMTYTGDEVTPWTNQLPTLKDLKDPTIVVPKLVRNSFYDGYVDNVPDNGIIYLPTQAYFEQFYIKYNNFKMLYLFTGDSFIISVHDEENQGYPILNYEYVPNGGSYQIGTQTFHILISNELKGFTVPTSSSFVDVSGSYNEDGIIYHALNNSTKLIFTAYDSSGIPITTGKNIVVKCFVNGDDLPSTSSGISGEMVQTMPDGKATFIVRCPPALLPLGGYASYYAFDISNKSDPPIGKLVVPWFNTFPQPASTLTIAPKGYFYEGFCGMQVELIILNGGKRDNFYITDSSNNVVWDGQINTYGLGVAYVTRDAKNAGRTTYTVHSSGKTASCSINWLNQGFPGVFIYPPSLKFETVNTINSYVSSVNNVLFDPPTIHWDISGAVILLNDKGERNNLQYAIGVLAVLKGDCTPDLRFEPQFIQTGYYDPANDQSGQDGISNLTGTMPMPDQWVDMFSQSPGNYNIGIIWRYFGQEGETLKSILNSLALELGIELGLALLPFIGRVLKPLVTRVIISTKKLVRNVTGWSQRVRSAKIVPSDDSLKRLVTETRNTLSEAEEVLMDTRRYKFNIQIPEPAERLIFRRTIKEESKDYIKQVPIKEPVPPAAIDELIEEQVKKTTKEITELETLEVAAKVGRSVDEGGVVIMHTNPYGGADVQALIKAGNAKKLGSTIEGKALEVKINAVTTVSEKITDAAGNVVTRVTEVTGKAANTVLAAGNSVITATQGTLKFMAKVGDGIINQGKGRRSVLTSKPPSGQTSSRNIIQPKQPPKATAKVGQNSSKKLQQPTAEPPTKPPTAVPPTQEPIPIPKTSVIEPPQSVTMYRRDIKITEGIETIDPNSFVRNNPFSKLLNTSETENVLEGIKRITNQTVVKQYFEKLPTRYYLQNLHRRYNTFVFKNVRITISNDLFKIFNSTSPFNPFTIPGAIRVGALIGAVTSIITHSVKLYKRANRYKNINEIINDDIELQYYYPPPESNIQPLTMFLQPGVVDAWLASKGAADAFNTSLSLVESEKALQQNISDTITNATNSESVSPAAAQRVYNTLSSVSGMEFSKQLSNGLVKTPNASTQIVARLQPRVFVTDDTGMLWFTMMLPYTFVVKPIFTGERTKQNMLVSAIGSDRPLIFTGQDISSILVNANEEAKKIIPNISQAIITVPALTQIPGNPNRFTGFVNYIPVGGILYIPSSPGITFIISYQNATITVVESDRNKDGTPGIDTITVTINTKPPVTTVSRVRVGDVYSVNSQPFVRVSGGSFGFAALPSIPFSVIGGELIFVRITREKDASSLRLLSKTFYSPTQVDPPFIMQANTKYNLMAESRNNLRFLNWQFSDGSPSVFNRILTYNYTVSNNTSSLINTNTNMTSPNVMAVFGNPHVFVYSPYDPRVCKFTVKQVDYGTETNTTMYSADTYFKTDTIGPIRSSFYIELIINTSEYSVDFNIERAGDTSLIKNEVINSTIYSFDLLKGDVFVTISPNIRNLTGNLIPQLYSHDNSVNASFLPFDISGGDGDILITDPKGVSNTLSVLRGDPPALQSGTYLLKAKNSRRYAFKFWSFSDGSPDVMDISFNYTFDLLKTPKVIVTGNFIFVNVPFDISGNGDVVITGIFNGESKLLSTILDNTSSLLYDPPVLPSQPYLLEGLPSPKHVFRNWLFSDGRTSTNKILNYTFNINILSNPASVIITANFVKPHYYATPPDGNSVIKSVLPTVYTLDNITFCVEAAMFTSVTDINTGIIKSTLTQPLLGLENVGFTVRNGGSQSIFQNQIIFDGATSYSIRPTGLNSSSVPTPILGGSGWTIVFKMKGKMLATNYYGNTMLFAQGTPDSLSTNDRTAFIGYFADSTPYVNGYPVPISAPGFYAGGWNGTTKNYSLIGPISPPVFYDPDTGMRTFAGPLELVLTYSNRTYNIYVNGAPAGSALDMDDQSAVPAGSAIFDYTRDPTNTVDSYYLGGNQEVSPNTVNNFLNNGDGITYLKIYNTPFSLMDVYTHFTGNVERSFIAPLSSTDTTTNTIVQSANRVIAMTKEEINRKVYNISTGSGITDSVIQSFVIPALVATSYTDPDTTKAIHGHLGSMGPNGNDALNIVLASDSASAAKLSSLLGTLSAPLNAPIIAAIPNYYTKTFDLTTQSSNGGSLYLAFPKIVDASYTMTYPNSTLYDTIIAKGGIVYFNNLNNPIIIGSNIKTAIGTTLHIVGIGSTQANISKSVAFSSSQQNSLDTTTYNTITNAANTLLGDISGEVLRATNISSLLSTAFIAASNTNAETAAAVYSALNNKYGGQVISLSQVDAKNVDALRPDKTVPVLQLPLRGVFPTNSNTLPTLPSDGSVYIAISKNTIGSYKIQYPGTSAFDTISVKDTVSGNQYFNDKLITIGASFTTAIGSRIQIAGIGSFVGNILSSPDPVCFLADAPVLTPSGYKAISELRIGDLVKAADGSSVAVRNVKVQHVVACDSTNPFVIPKGSFGATKRLMISPNHKVYVKGRGMVRAAELGLEQRTMRGSFDYYNLELEGYKTMVVAGVVVESLAPTKRIVVTMEEFKELVMKKCGRWSPEVLEALRHTYRTLTDGRVEVSTVTR
jgi:hypothetical protein